MEKNIDLRLDLSFVKSVSQSLLLWDHGWSILLGPAVRVKGRVVILVSFSFYNVVE